MKDFKFGQLGNESIFLVSSYGVSQALNILLQFFIIYELGSEFYAAIGLSYALIMTVIFVGELGYSHYFIRTVSEDDEWVCGWRSSLFHKLTATLILSLLLNSYLVFVAETGDASLEFFWGAWPGLFLAAFNCSAIFIAQKKALFAAKILLVQVSLYSLLSMIVVSLEPSRISLWIGLCFTFSQLVQLGYGLYLSGQKVLFSPTISWGGRGQIRSALNLWQLGVMGAVYDRALLILIEKYQPGILAIYLLASQLYQGISGLLSHVQKVFLRVLVDVRQSGKDILDVSGAISKYLSIALLLGNSIAFVLIFYWVDRFGKASSGDAELIFCLIIAEWSLNIFSMLVVPMLISSHREAYLRKIVVNSQMASLLFQIIAVFPFGIVPVALIRVIFALLALLLLAGKLHSKVLKVSQVIFLLPLLVAFAVMKSFVILVTFIIAIALLIVVHKRIDRSGMVN